jgi:hypothetical protein
MPSMESSFNGEIIFILPNEYNSSKSQEGRKYLHYKQESCVLSIFSRDKIYCTRQALITDRGDAQFPVVLE